MRLGRIREDANLDKRGADFARELEGIGEQVDEHLLEQRCVPFAAGQLSDPHFDLALGLASLQIRHDPLHDRVQIYRAARERRATEAAELQEVVDELIHALGTRDHLIQPAAAFRGYALAELGQIQIGESADRPQG